jgi:uncharacterized protein
VGLSKAGIRGVDIANVALFALVFSSKKATGVALPILCFADILAVVYYKRHVSWPHIFKFLPWVIIGVLLGVWVGKDLNEYVFRKIISTTIFISIGIMIWLDRSKNIKLPKGWWFETLMGLLTGFTTMVGNLAGSISNVYFLVLKFPKNEFLGTVSVLFLIVNLFKVPFHIWSWQTINTDSFKTSLFLFPGVIIGFFLGLAIVKQLNNEVFRILILATTILGSLLLFLK